MKVNASALILSLATTALIGCANPDAGTQASLLVPFSAHDQGAATGSFTFHAKGRTAEIASKLELPLTTAELRIDVDASKARLVSMSFPLDDIQISAAAVPPAGLQLRNISVRLAQDSAADIDARSSDAVALRGTMPMEVTWDLDFGEGRVFPAAPIKIPGLGFDVDLVLAADGDTLSVELQASCTGTCWSLPGFVDVSDLGLRLSLPARLGGTSTR